MYYNYTNLTLANNYYEYVVALNNLSGGYIVLMLLGTFFLITFIMFRAYNAKMAILGSSFVCSILAIMFWLIDLLAFNMVIYPVILLAASLLIQLFWGD